MPLRKSLETYRMHLELRMMKTLLHLTKNQHLSAYQPNQELNEEFCKSQKQLGKKEIAWKMYSYVRENI